jgi:pimeloyl-ACP methyl ester carboxylesterase
MIEHPYYPIVYIRGYAGSQGAVERTVATPYMGFNTGSTKLRQEYDGAIDRHIFESPLIRLGKDHGYTDVYEDGEVASEGTPVSARSVWVFRYYDQVSKEMPEQSADRPEIEAYAEQLGVLLNRIRDQVCGVGDDPAVQRDRDRFKVYLVAHSMGGLIARCYLQNRAPGTVPVPVDKVFTYGTPHRGIDLKMVGNLLNYFPVNNAEVFNRTRMRDYLALSKDAEIESLDGRFPKSRFFCLVGTNHRDYDAAMGASRAAVGAMSDGLVQIRNATVEGAPRAFVHRSHSGEYGLVNSEDGYQNLRRFLFGDARVDVLLDVDTITLPPDIWERKERGDEIEASYHFEAIIRVRGARWDLHRRTVHEESAQFVDYARLQRSKPITLGSVYLLDSAKVDEAGSLGFSVDLRLLVPNYRVDKRLWLDDYYEGGYVHREKYNFEFDLGDPPSLQWGVDSQTTNRATRSLQARRRSDEVFDFVIPIADASHPKLTGDLIIRTQPWNREVPTAGAARTGAV